MNLQWQDFSAPSIKPKDKTLEQQDLTAANIEKAMDLAAPFIERHEGYRENAYWDDIGKRWTVGHGHTFITDPATGERRAVQKGDVLGRSASSALVRDALRRNATKIYKNLAWSRTLSPEALAALYDIAYNAGPAALYSRSSPTLNRLMNQPLADKEEIVWSQVPTYRTSGGKVVRGLVNRRNDSIRQFRPYRVVKDTGRGTYDLGALQVR